VSYVLTFSAIDTEGKDKPADPLAALEKSTDAQTHVMKVQVPRLEAIQDLSDRYNEDPYAASVRARKRFRHEKKVDIAKKEVDDAIKGRYGLSEDLKLLEDGDDEKAAAKEEWVKGRLERHSRRDAKKRKLEVDRIGLVNTVKGSSGSGSSPSSALSSLRAKILENTAKRSVPSSGSGRAKHPDARLIVRK
jgi:coiled-coil domain-containing protein 130